MVRVAAIITVYQEWSHGDALGTKFLKGTSTDEGYFPPEVRRAPSCLRDGYYMYVYSCS